MRTSIVVGAALTALSGAAPATPPNVHHAAVLHFTVPAPCSTHFGAAGPPSETAANHFGKTCFHNTDVHLAASQVHDDIHIPSDSPLVATIPADVSAFCAGYPRADRGGRTEFWATLLTAIARPESNYNPADSMWEGPNDPEYSVGLLQISPSNKGPYGCAFQSEADLANPDANLACGVKVLTKLVTRANRIGGDLGHGRAGAAAYWSTLRVVAAKPGAAVGRLAADTRSEIIGKTAALPVCKASAG